MPELSQTEVDAAFGELAGAGLRDRPTCGCEVRDHHPNGDRWCGNAAKVQLRIHLVHVCRHPDTLRTGKVDPEGCTVQLMCLDCWRQMQIFANAKIAATRARCTTLSTSCQRCGNGLALRAPAQPGGVVLLRECPNCGLERIHFAPVCGSGVFDREGKSYGCGAALDSHLDVIRGVTWLDEQE